MTKHLHVCSVAVASLAVTGAFEGDGIPITIPGNHLGNPGNDPHSPVRYLAQGYYDLEADALSLSFLQSVGPCTVTVTNTAEEVFVQPFDSDWGTCTMYLTGTPGLYSITIETGAGDQFHGSFILF